MANHHRNAGVEASASSSLPSMHKLIPASSKVTLEVRRWPRDDEMRGSETRPRDEDPSPSSASR